MEVALLGCMQGAVHLVLHQVAPHSLAVMDRQGLDQDMPLALDMPLVLDRHLVVDTHLVLDTPAYLKQHSNETG